jgi:hypothetical protein
VVSQAHIPDIGQRRFPALRLPRRPRCRAPLCVGRRNDVRAAGTRDLGLSGRRVGEAIVQNKAKEESVKYEVSSVKPEGAPTGPSDFRLRARHSTLPVRKTKPICDRANWWITPVGKRSYVKPTRMWSRENEASLRGSCRFEVPSVKLERIRLVPSDFRLDTSTFKLRGVQNEANSRKAWRVRSPLWIRGYEDCSPVSGAERRSQSKPIPGGEIGFVPPVATWGGGVWTGRRFLGAGLVWRGGGAYLGADVTGVIHEA